MSSATTGMERARVVVYHSGKGDPSVIAAQILNITAPYEVIGYTGLGKPNKYNTSLPNSVALADYLLLEAGVDIGVDTTMSMQEVGKSTFIQPFNRHEVEGL